MAVLALLSDPEVVGKILRRRGSEGFRASGRRVQPQGGRDGRGKGTGDSAEPFLYWMAAGLRGEWRMGGRSDYLPAERKMRLLGFQGAAPRAGAGGARPAERRSQEVPCKSQV